jgi:adenylate kinase
VGVPAISNLFPNFGTPAKIKLLIVGTHAFLSETLTDQLRSLNLEHVSPAGLMQQEISRRTPLGQMAERAVRSGKGLSDETLIALMRRWFWARKPDAGFALTGFPATMLQAKIFDEWLDARDEALNGVIVEAVDSTEPTVGHYRTLGLLIEARALAA